MNTTVMSTPPPGPYNADLNVQDKEVLSDNVREIAEQTIVLVMLPLSALGIITNIINIRVFVEQGVRNDSTNIGFLSLSIFDLLCCVSLIPFSLCYVLKAAFNMPKHLTCIAFATQFLHVHVITQRCSAWTTVYMSLMRCLCVFIPLRVKLIFTQKATLIVIFSMVIFFILNLLPYAMFIEIVWVFDPHFNESFAYVLDSPFAQEYLYHNTVFSTQVLPVVAIIIVSVTTGMMIRKLQEVKKWRQMNASVSGKGSTENPKTLSSKDIELVKSVTAITCIFLFCVLMSYVPAIAILTTPGVNFSGVNRNLFYVLCMARFLFNAINSSINFFFYINISSRYKTAMASSFPILYASRNET